MGNRDWGLEGKWKMENREWIRRSRERGAGNRVAARKRRGSLRHSPACPENPYQAEAVMGNECPGHAYGMTLSKKRL
jgi:hypothetical protein